MLNQKVSFLFVFCLILNNFNMGWCKLETQETVVREREIGETQDRTGVGFKLGLLAGRQGVKE